MNGKPRSKIPKPSKDEGKLSKVTFVALHSLTVMPEHAKKFPKLLAVYNNLSLVVAPVRSICCGAWRSFGMPPRCGRSRLKAKLELRLAVARHQEGTFAKAESFFPEAGPWQLRNRMSISVCHRLQ